MTISAKSSKLTCVVPFVGVESSHLTRRAITQLAHAALESAAPSASSSVIVREEGSPSTFGASSEGDVGADPSDLVTRGNVEAV